jgi:hypothetical protein
MLSDEGLRNAASAMSSAAETMRNAASSLYDTLEQDRRLRAETFDVERLRSVLGETVAVAAGELRKLGREAKLDSATALDLLEKRAEEYVTRLERVAEMQALAALVQYEASRVAHDTTKYGEERCEPSANPGVLEAWLKKRGVL